MILALLGPDAYRKRQRRLAAITDFGVAMAEIIRIDGDSATIQVLDDALLSLGLFATKRVVVIPAVGTLPKPVASRLVTLLSVVSQETLLILEADKLDQRTELAKTVKTVPTETFEPLRGSVLERWISDEATALGVTIEPDARRRLVERAGSDSWRLRSELQKLAAVASGRETKRITSDDVRDCVVAAIDANAFALTDALVAGDRRAARLALARLAASGEAPLAVLGTLGYFLRTLALVKDAAETNRRAALHPFVVTKTLPAARTVRWSTIVGWYVQLVETDWAVKTGTLDADVGVELLVHTLTDSD
jgi:DNA polymerase-3 subunit delta